MYGANMGSVLFREINLVLASLPDNTRNGGIRSASFTIGSRKEVRNRFEASEQYDRFWSTKPHFVLPLIVFLLAKESSRANGDCNELGGWLQRSRKMDFLDVRLCFRKAGVTSYFASCGYCIEKKLFCGNLG